ncbi:MAG: DUF4418 family protein [Christensenella sp.]
MQKKVRILSVFLIIFGLLLVFIPNSFMCKAMLETVKGMSVPMKCHWTGIFQILIGILAMLAGIINFFFKEKGAWTATGIFTTGCGVTSLIVTNALIGVCKNPTMVCNMAGKPAANLLAILVLAMGVLIIFFAQHKHGGQNV